MVNAEISHFYVAVCEHFADIDANFDTLKSTAIDQLNGDLTTAFDFAYAAVKRIMSYLREHELSRKTSYTHSDIRLLCFDLRSPVDNVSSAAQIILEDASTQLDDNQRQQLIAAQESCAKIHTLMITFENSAQ